MDIILIKDVKDVLTSGNLAKQIIQEPVPNVSQLIGTSQERIKSGRRKNEFERGVL